MTFQETVERPITPSDVSRAIDDVWQLFTTLITAGPIPENSERYDTLAERDLDTVGALCEQLKAHAALHQAALDNPDPDGPWRPLGAYWLEQEAIDADNPI